MNRSASEFGIALTIITLMKMTIKSETRENHSYLK